MPVYNTSNNLPRLFDLLTSVPDIFYEIIPVEDYSTDNSRTVIEEYACKYNFIKPVYHTENRGLSSARNSGLTVANGNYIWFVDSDDLLNIDLVKTIIAKINENPADITVFGLVEKHIEGKKEWQRKIVPANPGIYRKNLISLVPELEKSTLYGYAWNKIYSKDFLIKNNLVFERITLIEDICFNIKAFSAAESINILNIAPYYYIKEDKNSLTAKFLSNYFGLNRRRIELIYNQLEDADCLNDNSKQILANIFVRYVFSALQRNCDKRANYTHINRRQFLTNLYKDNLFLNLITHSQNGGILINIMGTALKHRCTFLCLCIARLIYITKFILPRIFYKLK